MKRIFTVLVAVVMLAIGANAAFEKVNTYNGNFSDVKDTSWYAGNVQTAYELGFMNGKSEGKFDPDGNVTIAEGITMASRLHAIYNGIDIDSYSKNADVIRFDFDNLDNISFNYFEGKVENGVLVGNSKARSNGSHDPGIYMNNLELDSRNYNKMVVRMKRDALENPNGAARSETVEVFFSHDAVVVAEKCVRVKLTATPLEEWFEFEVDFSKHPLWKDKITRVRFDPTNNNGVYYVDYIYFTKGEETSSKWYFKYVDYATEKGIITGTTYKEEDYTKNISRAELCRLFAAALPESYFGKINNVNAIPDLDKNNEYSDILLMLYRAGVVLGSDATGNFNAFSDIKRSETSAIINRVALPENRVKGSISAVWDNPDYASDAEFEDPSLLANYPVEAESAEIKDGAFVLKSLDRGEGKTPRYDPKITLSGLNIKAEDYPVMRVRMKADFIGELATNTKCDIYYMHEDDETFSEMDSYHPDLYEKSYVDAAGWTVFEINMARARNWAGNGNITAIRFDPTNNNGIFTIDYIRFVRSEATRVVTDAELAANYTERRIFPMDEMLENGAYVVTPGDRIAQTSTNAVEGIWSYNDNGKEPIWRLMPLWTDTCLIKNRDTTTDKYTIADTDGNKLVAYDPSDKSMRLRLDATKIYKGEPTLKSDKWAHLIFEYDPYDDDYRKVPEDKKAFLDLSADKVYLEMDVKLNDYIVSYEEKEGGLNLSSLLFFMYFAHKDVPNFHTYFGLIPFGKDGPYDRTDFIWFNDSHSQQKIYQVSPQFLYGGDITNSFWRPDGKHLTGEWKKIRVDITPQIENLIRVMNEDNAYGNKVSVEDFWIAGFNAGYEIRGGNMLDMIFRNFNLICYDKK